MKHSGYHRVNLDWYVEPSWVVENLLKVEEISGSCWDPAAGGGTIPKALTKFSLSCKATDIVKRYPESEEVDFLQANFTEKVDNIISNPPYAFLQEWVEKSLSLTNKKVIILARLAFLESQKRNKFFKTTPLSKVWVSSSRPSMPPGGSIIPATGGTIAYAWFVWEHGTDYEPTIGWLP